MDYRTIFTSDLDKIKYVYSTYINFAFLPSFILFTGILFIVIFSDHIHIHVHVTPYQVKDKMRPWIGKEEKIFTEILIEYKANVTRQLHFHNQPASLNQHFELLNSFT